MTIEELMKTMERIKFLRVKKEDAEGSFKNTFDEDDFRPLSNLCSNGALLLSIKYSHLPTPSKHRFKTPAGKSPYI